MCVTIVTALITTAIYAYGNNNVIILLILPIFVLVLFARDLFRQISILFNAELSDYAKVYTKDIHVTKFESCITYIHKYKAFT